MDFPLGLTGGYRTIQTWDFYLPKSQTYRTGDMQARRGLVIDTMDTCATVRDEHTGEEFEHNIRDLDVCSARGRVLLRTNSAYSLVGRRVQVCRGPLKGYRATVKDIHNCGVTVEVEARLVSGMSADQLISWYDFVLLLNEVEARETTPPRTRTPEPTTTPARLTPEPEGHTDGKGNSSHWLLSADMQAVLERRCVPLSVSGVRGGVLDQYEGKTVRTLPIARRRSTPESGELIVNIIKRGRIKQLSINAGFLKPWEPVPNGEVVIIEGPLRGTVGKVHGITGHICTIRSEESAGASTHYVKPEKVAYLEPLGSS